MSIMTLHAAKGLEFPVVYMLAVENGLLPHERSIHKEEDLEEERRLAFVGMTRAKEELYLTYCKMREFRGQTNYAIPSMFLGELLHEGEGVEETDLSTSSRNRSPDKWRDAAKSASKGWYDAGTFDQPTKNPCETSPFTEGMLVHHDSYGVGRVTSISGNGALRKIKIRFTTTGERTFLADKAKLSIVQAK